MKALILRQLITMLHYPKVQRNYFEVLPLTLSLGNLK
jgi:hypothetical protein